MKLSFNHQEFVFREVDLVFLDSVFTDVFSMKNNKTLRETIKHKRYLKFRIDIEIKYPEYLDYELGAFLIQLKQNNDGYYKNFLNKYGDSTYSIFKIEDTKAKVSKGLYLYSVGNDLKYIGRCRDSFGKRINQGYGKIHPKNCYIDGQSTNCHLNSLITQNREGIRFYILELNNETQIMKLEEELIRLYKPEWNISLKAI